MSENLNIVKMIEKNPITRLSKTYQNELLTKIKSTFASGDQQMFVGSFYCFLNYSKNDFVINFDDVWKWIGFTRKDNAKRILDKYFIENVDYKINLNQSEEKTKGRQEEQILLTVNTFKKYCLKANTKKSDEVHNYYIKLEELLQETINLQTDEMRNQLTIKDKESEEKDKKHKIELKKQRHETLVELMKTKCCIYIGEINSMSTDEKKFIKIGSSKQVDSRSKSLNSEYGDLTFLEIFESENYREVEISILNDPKITKNLYKESIKTNGGTSKEVILLSDTLNYNQLLSIVKQHVNNGNMTNITSANLLEIKRLEIEKQKLEIANKQIDKEIMLNIFDNNKYPDRIQQLIDKIYPNIVENIIKNINKEEIKEQIDNRLKEHIECNIKEEVKEQIDEKVKDEKEQKNIEENNKIIANNELLKKTKVSNRKPLGRKIQMIDPNDLKKVIKVYDSMMYLMRAPENDRFSKAGVEKALTNNTIYQGYRWCYVENGDDPIVSKAKPTVPSKSTQKSDVILQLNNTKTQIIKHFQTQKELAKYLSVSVCKARKIMKNNIKHNDNYYIYYYDCSPELIKKYGDIKKRVVSAQSCGKICRIDPITLSETVFETFEEIDTKLGIRRPTIKKAIETKTMHAGSLWKYYDENNPIAKKQPIVCK